MVHSIVAYDLHLYVAITQNFVVTRPRNRKMEGLGVKSQANSTNRVLEAIYMVADIMSKVLQAIFFM